MALKLVSMSWIKTFKEIRKLGINDNILKEELLKRVKVSSYIPESREREFTTTIFETYKTFCKEIK